MLRRQKTKVTIQRPAPYTSDGAGGWYSDTSLKHDERATLRNPSYKDVERAGLETAQIDIAVDFTWSADVQRQDVIVVPSYGKVEVIALPDENIPGYVRKTAFCKKVNDQHGQG